MHFNVVRRSDCNELTMQLIISQLIFLNFFRCEIKVRCSGNIRLHKEIWALYVFLNYWVKEILFSKVRIVNMKMETNGML